MSKPSWALDEGQLGSPKRRVINPKMVLLFLFFSTLDADESHPQESEISAYQEKYGIMLEREAPPKAISTVHFFSRLTRVN